MRHDEAEGDLGLSDSTSNWRPLNVVLAVALIAIAIVAILEPIYFTLNPQVVTTTVTTTSTSSTMSLISTTSTTTSVTTSTLSMTSTVTLPGPTYGVPTYGGSSSFNMNSPACQYPLNPYLCNEGPPVTIIGMFLNETSCLTVYGTVTTASGYSQEQTFVVWFYPSAPSTIPTNTIVQVFGYVYPDWPAGVPFPPYPFQGTICTGIPLASIPPYYKIGG